ncbi:MAG TPA: ABC transporter permease [Pyrinomonadaceae bacterium]|jgi:putative ABC transport system permease protein|nr:ABC transporter permease [Pyrinomonadaceae bacterium]
MRFAKLILKNVLRNKLRTLLTVSSLVVSLFLIVTLGTILTEMQRGSEEGNPSRLMSRHSVSLAFLLPIADVQRIQSVPGVKAVMPFTWFGGIYKDERNFFANFAADAAKLREIYPELKMSDAEWQAFIADRQGAIVGKKLQLLHGFQPGQRITLKSPIYNKDVEFIVRGICTGGDEKTLFFHHDYLSELAPDWARDQAGMFAMLANSPDQVARIGQEIDAMFVNTDAPTKTESEREFAASFEAMTGSIKQFLYAIMAAITFSLLLVMGNTMAMTVRERTKEVGTLKAIGFKRHTIAGLFIGESVLLAIIGGAIGIGAAVLIYRAVDMSVYIPTVVSFIPQPQTLITAFLLSIFVGVFSVAYSTYRVTGLTIAEALRSTE